MLFHGIPTLRPEMGAGWLNGAMLALQTIDNSDNGLWRQPILGDENPQKTIAHMINPVQLLSRLMVGLVPSWLGRHCAGLYRRPCHHRSSSPMLCITAS